MPDKNRIFEILQKIILEHPSLEGKAITLDLDTRIKSWSPTGKSGCTTSSDLYQHPLYDPARKIINLDDLSYEELILNIEEEFDCELEFPENLCGFGYFYDYAVREFVDCLAQKLP